MRRLVALLSVFVVAALASAQDYNVPGRPRTAVTCQFQALGGYFASGANPTDPAWPTHQTNDIALLIVETANEVVTLSPANGFVEIADSPQGTGSLGTRLTIFWARATSGAMSAPGVPDSGNHTQGRLLTFRGCITSGNPWDVTAGDTAAVASTSVSIPGDTTTVTNTLVVSVATTDEDGTGSFTSEANADLTNFTVRDEQHSTAGNGGGYLITTGTKAAAGAYGATTATLATAGIQGRISLALKSQ